MKKKWCLGTMSLLALMALSSCGETGQSLANNHNLGKGIEDSSDSEEREDATVPEHAYSSEWSKDGKSHWHACLDEGYSDLKSDEAEHDYSVTVTSPTFENEGYTTHTCSVCGFVYFSDATPKLEHTYSSDWTSDSSTHWHACLDEGYLSLKGDEACHSYECDVHEASDDYGGYTIFTCVDCGYWFRANETPSNGHPYTVFFDLGGGSSVSYAVSKGVDYLSSSDFFFDCQKSGYNFRGWSYMGSKVFDEDGTLLYYPSMDSVMIFTAVYEENARIKIGTNIAGGNPSGAGYYDYYASALLLASPYYGYSFLGWYDEWDSLVSEATSLSYVVGTSDVTLTAKYAKVAFDLTVRSSNGELGLIRISSLGSEASGSYTSSETCLIYSTRSVTLTASSQNSSVPFLGWYDEDGNLVSSSKTFSFIMPSCDYSLEGKWDRFKINYELDGGTNSASNPTEISSGEKATLYAPRREGYDFKGWVNASTGESVDEIPAGTLSDLTLLASWERMSDERRSALGVSMVFDMEKGTLTYGLYPQKKVSDESTIASLESLEEKEDNSWYLLDDCYYAKKKASPCASNSVFDDGTRIVPGEAYWFKCEPIEWRILSSAGGYSLISASLLDAHRYGASSNIYESSEIRKWLNGDFYDKVFYLGDSLIETSGVDNSALSTGCERNPYASSATADKVYLPSYQDCVSPIYSYSSDPYEQDANRQCKTTDYARASGAYSSLDPSSLSEGYYWTRSPISCSSSFAWSVNEKGDLGADNVGVSNCGVRPCLKLRVA